MAPILKYRGDDQVLAPPFLYFLIWFLLFQILLFFGFILVSEGYAQIMFQTDRSHISFVILFVFFFSSLHAGFHLYRMSALQEEVYQQLGWRFIDLKGKGEGLVSRYLDELQDLHSSKHSSQIDQANYIFEIYVDKLRAPIELGSFWSDVLIRLGLVGTIVGFILMLKSFVSGPAPSDENIQQLLLTMSGGMGTALYTTLAGLVTSTLLSLQHQLLGRLIESIIGGFIRLSSHLDFATADIPREVKH